jgi:hypothetical protein
MASSLWKSQPQHHGIMDEERPSPGERIVFEADTREICELTHRWMEDLKLFPAEQIGQAPDAVAADG